MAPTRNPLKAKTSGNKAAPRKAWVSPKTQMDDSKTGIFFLNGMPILTKVDQAKKADKNEALQKTV